jgi:hypothetical protein
MAFTYKTLGQTAPSTTNNANAYTVPANTEAVVSSIFICNVSSASATFKVFQRINGAAAANSNAIAFEQLVPARSTTSIEGKITLGAGDILTVQSSVADALTFTINGSEITA